MLAVFEELYYAANNQKMADKKKADYQEGLEKSCTDSAARSRESYKNDLEKSRDDNAARSHESYLKDPEKRCAQNRKSYKKDPIGEESLK